MAERLFQIGIKGLITNKEGKILLLQSSSSDGSVRWDLPGGRMDEDETFEQTLERELIEEIGTSYTEKPTFIDTVLSHATIAVGDKQVGLVLLIYRASIPEDIKLKLNDYETAYEWVSPSEATIRLKNKYPMEFTKKLAEYTL